MDTPIAPSGIHPTFSQILETLNIVPSDLAENAGVTQNTVSLMIANKPVFQEYAEKVLSALSAMTQQSHTLENVDVNLLMIVSNQSEVANLMQRIEQEYTASERGLVGLAEGTAKHEYMTKRLENIADHHAALVSLVGEGVTNQLMEQVGEWASFMYTQEKMFYTPSEASSYLNVKEDVLPKWMNRLHIAARTLPNTKGEFIPKRDVLLIQENLKQPDILIWGTIKTWGGKKELSHYDTRL